MCSWERFTVTKEDSEGPPFVHDNTAIDRQATIAIATLRFMQGVFTTNGDENSGVHVGTA
jgi:hypothetical protein